MSQRTIAFAGISGVGKSTFLRSAAKKIPFQHLTAGSLIGVARDSERDRLRLQNIDENQRLLVAGFEMAKNSTKKLVVIDGHVIIDAGDGLQEINASVFAALGVGAIVHLEAEASQILTNREGDESRDRPRLTISPLT
ncbi:ATP-binding protein [uncultured Agrobacterium sp.]|uniref:ATP-binding protein n=1 Tax=uncultured Agrobacterium sp. TaxID=157277 RepID=UPI0025F5C050|nr:ATP-binding protein [uncultured Agrobacterium sp.]